jgi:2-oxoglutarate dehydrogenase complex dehydrogenase (E1) component-like enzyme
MYKQVAKMTPVARIYEQQLVDEGVATQEDLDGMKKRIHEHMEHAYNESKTWEFKPEHWITKEWE